MKPQGRKSRLSSGTDLDFEKFDVPEYFDVLTQLDMYYGQVKRQILCNQCPTTGLFPRYPNNKKYGYIKDSIYCAAAIWSLHQAYRRIDDDRGKSMELGQSVVKCMRGILFCWMKQSKSNMEKFKKNQVPEHALHSIFDLKTGSVVPEISNYGHLQIDAVSLYLLFLVQTITSGLQIIFTMDEVNFVQNLVYYVERAYRTPDFGMWERGSKYNDGKAELHASSIGMAKAAMEAINGCNVFGEKGASWSVIYVDIDAHHRNHSIFQTMLPRESWSKNIDASLLPVISFPCFAIHDPVLYAKTKNKIIKKLEGSYGLKRFLRDGYGTVLEDEDREFYYQGETKEFEGIECEWPLFFIYLIIEGMFTGDADQVSEYQKKLSPLLRSDKNGDTIVPQYYYVDSENVAAEKANPNSQVKHPYIANNKNGCKVFMWGQSMYIISQLLVNNLLHIHELDLIRRFLPSYNRPRSLLSNRYSAFQGSASDLVVQVVLITESMRLQAMMATYGIQTQTPHEVEPVQIWSPSELVKVFEYLGVNHKLDLKGRPSRPIGALGTSKIYRVHSQTVLCYPLIFEVSDFYLSHDMAVLIDNIKKEIQFVGTNWRLSGRPTVCILIREEHMRDIHFKEMVDLLATFRTGRCEGVKIRTGRLQNLISSSCIEHLDFLNTVTDIKSEFIPFKQVKHASIGYQSLTDIKSAVYLSEPQQSFSFFKTKPTHEIIDTLMYMESMQGQSRLLGMLLEREGPNLHLSNGTVKESLEKLARKAGEIRNWSVVRYCSSLLGKLVDSISPYITSILVSGKQITFGVFGHEEGVVDKPMTPAELRQMIYNLCQKHEPWHAVMQQEVVQYLGRLISTSPHFFNGILKIRIGWIIQAISVLRSITSSDEDISLECLSPSEIRKLIHKVLTINEWADSEGLTSLQRRQINGALCKVPLEFYDDVWNILMRMPQGLIVAGDHLPQQPTLSEMTVYELNFSLKVELLLSRISNPEYRQIMVELIVIISIILKRNEELCFHEAVDLDKLIHKAFEMFKKETNLDPNLADMILFYEAPRSTVSSYLARTFVDIILKSDVSTPSPCNIS